MCVSLSGRREEGKGAEKGKAVRASALGRVFFVSREKSKVVPIARVGEELL